MNLHARKDRAWEHTCPTAGAGYTALTAAATWFVAGVKLKWCDAYTREPILARQFKLEVLPALSMAYARDFLQAVLPVPQLMPDQARGMAATHLVNRARSTASRLRIQRSHEDSS